MLLLPLFAAQWDKIENNIPYLLEKEQQFMVIIFWKFQYLNSHNDFGLRIKWVYYPNFEFPFDMLEQFMLKILEYDLFEANN